MKCSWLLEHEYFPACSSSNHLTRSKTAWFQTAFRNSASSLSLEAGFVACRDRRGSVPAGPTLGLFLTSGHTSGLSFDGKKKQKQWDNVAFERLASKPSYEFALNISEDFEIIFTPCFNQKLLPIVFIQHLSIDVYIHGEEGWQNALPTAEMFVTLKTHDLK
jgi:hypothetical protein